MGIEKLGVIQRISQPMRKPNTVIFQWQIAIELQNKFPDLPLIIDPSHYW
jgi:chorismate mutase